MIISYNLIPKMSTLLENLNCKVIIVDECHYMKNPNALRTKCLVPLLHKAKRAVLLSGTPALSRPIELFTQLNSLSPNSWPDMKAFGKRYCRTQQQQQSGGGSRNNSSSGGNGRSGWGGDFKGLFFFKYIIDILYIFLIIFGIFIILVIV
jgi:SNF2 family DNA or RNA helicase